MTISKKRNNKQFDIDSHGIRTNWAQIGHLYESQFRLPSDSDKTIEQAQEYLAHWRANSQTANIKSNPTTHAPNVNFIGWNNNVRTATSGRYPLTWPATINKTNINTDFVPTLNFLKGGTATSSNEVPYLNDPSTGVPFVNNIKAKYYNIVVTDSDGTPSHANVYNVFKHHFNRWLNWDFYARRDLTLRTLDSLQEDSDLVGRVARQVSIANVKYADIHKTNMQALFNRLDEKRIQQVGDSDYIGQYGAYLNSGTTTPQTYSSTIDSDKKLYRHQLARIVVDGMLDVPNTKTQRDIEVTELGVKSSLNMVGRLIPAHMQQIADSDSLRKTMWTTNVLKYFKYDSDAVNASESAIDASITPIGSVAKNERDRRLNQFAHLWYQFHDNDSDSRWGVQLQRHHSTYVQDSEKTRNLWLALMNRLDSTIHHTATSTDSDKVVLTKFTKIMVDGMTTDSDHRNKIANILAPQLAGYQKITDIPTNFTVGKGNALDAFTTNAGTVNINNGSLASTINIGNGTSSVKINIGNTNSTQTYSGTETHNGTVVHNGSVEFKGNVTFANALPTGPTTPVNFTVKNANGVDVITIKGKLLQ